MRPTTHCILVIQSSNPPCHYPHKGTRSTPRPGCTHSGTNLDFVDWSLCWLVFVNLAQIRITWEEGTSIEELPPSDWVCGHGWDGVLISDWYWRAQPTVCSVTLEQVIKNCMRNQGEQAMEIRSVSAFSLRFYFNFCPDSYNNEMIPGSKSQISPLLPRLVLVSVSPQQQESKLEQDDRPSMYLMTLTSTTPT